MSSGRDVYLERLAYEAREQSKKTDFPYEITYYLRVNKDKLTWGHMKQIDDNLKIVFNTSRNNFTVEYL